MHRLLSSFTISFALLALACQPTTMVFDTGDGSDGGDGDGDGDPGDGDPGDGDSGGPTLNCDPTQDMPCPDGQKCTVLLSGGQAIYDCVTDDTGLLPNEPCVPAPTTGQDQCPDTYVCIAPEDNPGMGVCLELCLDDTDCDAALCAEPPGLQIPVCAAICDPLQPLCPGQQDCQRVRQKNFVCQFPRPDDTGTNADGCNIVADSGCAEGFVCETGGIIPDCVEQSCCTSLCDLSDANPCPSPTVCGPLPLDPQPGLENVGACYVPQ